MNNEYLNYPRLIGKERCSSARLDLAPIKIEEVADEKQGIYIQ